MTHEQLEAFVVTSVKNLLETLKSVNEFDGKILQGFIELGNDVNRLRENVNLLGDMVATLACRVPDAQTAEVN